MTGREKQFELAAYRLKQVEPFIGDAENLLNMVRSYLKETVNLK